MKEYRPAKKRMAVSVGESVRIIRELQELRRQASSSIVIPQGGVPNLGGGGNIGPYYWPGNCTGGATAISSSGCIIAAKCTDGANQHVFFSKHDGATDSPVLYRANVDGTAEGGIATITRGGANYMTVAKNIPGPVVNQDPHRRCRR